ncbi:uncharacterized protein LOC131047962 [Cryptomeria japonica]|uniref:uncharacterized protein LOC131047962 n=1 Tax=Cryptomeria japonica TaxID=3369 RepID=UPI0025ABEC8B|nr:uncharacterized protein LOC131047962 [Cryptomeria japonica]XP_057837758.1 uncharacterized protein LOC131047962 [Cryptomeria japonica]XP_057837760.1 uncharacterized protein LOC131047962 [Cryptomeria japonica]
MAGGGKPDGKGDGIVAKTAGFAIFAGIAASIFKAFKPNKPVDESSYSDDIVVDQVNTDEVVKEASRFGFNKGGGKKKPPQTIEIFKGDTLWGLSQKYGVPVDQIKAANGYTDDTIYAGEKIIIP